MNLHGIVKGVIGAVNPLVPIAVQVSVGNVKSGSDGARAPRFATPGILTASITDDVMTVTFAEQGYIRRGQQINAMGVLPGTYVVEQLTGPKGGEGTYRVNLPQSFASAKVLTTLTILGQRQPVSFKDIQHLDGLNLQGVRDKIYIDGEIDGLVRMQNKGGDLITFMDGSTWKVAVVLEQWPDWASAGVTYQAGGETTPRNLFPSLLDFSRPFTPGAA